MVPSTPKPVDVDNAVLTSKRKVWIRRFRRWLVLYVVVPYVVLVLGFAVFQRRLLYRPTVVDAISPQDSRMPSEQVKQLEVTTHDGLKLSGWLLLPYDHSGAERLLVLYFPGNAENRIAHAPDCRDFTSLGADVAIFDYRGFGDNPGSPSQKDIAADARTIWKHLTQDLGLPAERIVLFGESLGGGVATRLASELCQNGTPPAGLIVASTFSSMTDTVAWHYPYFPVRMFLLDRYPSDDRITEVTCPIVCLHGTEDKIVPIELAEKLFAAAPETSASGVKKRFIASPGMGHNATSRESLEQAVRGLFDTDDNRQSSK